MNIMCLVIFHPFFTNIYLPNIWFSAWYFLIDGSSFQLYFYHDFNMGNF
jgi:hypothetical protein